MVSSLVGLLKFVVVGGDDVFDDHHFDLCCSRLSGC
jgi:hypothetical protein